MTLVSAFLEAAERHPDRPALIDGRGRALSYGALARRSAGLARAFAARGIGRGDRVLVAVWPGPALYAGLAALWRLGAVAVFPEPAMGLAGVRHAAAATRPKGLLAAPWARALAGLLPETRRIPVGLVPTRRARDRGDTPWADVWPEHPALISFTSGTGGTPKAMARSHALLMAQHAALTPLIGGDGAPQVDLVAFPAFVLTVMGHGHTAVLPGWPLRRHDRADPARIRAQAAAVGATRLLLPPAVTARLAGAPLPPSVRRVLTGGGAVYPDVARRLLDGAPGVGLTVVYGSTEAEPIAHLDMETLAPADWDEAAAGGGLPVGAPVPALRLRLVNDEIVVAGPHVNPGYLDPAHDRETKIREGATVWHRTGDAGRLDARGRLWLLGRRDTVAAGVPAFAVEAAARLWPGVRAAAVVVADDGRPTLALSGDAAHLSLWQREAARLGDLEVRTLPAIPMDRRHRSKPDGPRLRAALRRR